MRLLIDECVDPRVGRLFPGHEVKTVHDMGWDESLDGPLLRLAEQEFDAFLTIDRNLEHQQNLRKLRLALIVVAVSKNQLRHYERIQAELRDALERATAGTVIHVLAAGR